MANDEVKYIFARFWPYNLEGLSIESAIAKLQAALQDVQAYGWKDVRLRAEGGYNHSLIVLRGARPETDDEQSQRLEQDKLKAEREYNEYLRLKQKYEIGVNV